MNNKGKTWSFFPVLGVTLTGSRSLSSGSETLLRGGRHQKRRFLRMLSEKLNKREHFYICMEGGSQSEQLLF